jgi:hypothetical protein
VYPTLLTTCRVAQLGSLGPLRNVRTSTTRRGRNVVLHQSGRDIRATRVTTLQRRCFRSTAGGQQLRADEAEKLTASISRPRHPNDRTKYRRSGFSALGPGWVKTPPGMHAPGILRPVARRRAPELRHASFRRALRSDQIRSDRVFERPRPYPGSCRCNNGKMQQPRCLSLCQGNGRPDLQESRKLPHNL